MRVWLIPCGSNLEGRTLEHPVSVIDPLFASVKADLFAFNPSLGFGFYFKRALIEQNVRNLERCHRIKVL